MKRFVVSFLTTGLLLCFTCLRVLSSGQPSILFSFADAQRAHTIHALGNNRIQTPNLNRLVNQSAVFTHPHCMGDKQGDVCVTSRAMLMTGRTLFRIKENLEEQTTWSEILARAGYAENLGSTSTIHFVPHSQ